MFVRAGAEPLLAMARRLRVLRALIVMRNCSTAASKQLTQLKQMGGTFADDLGASLRAGINANVTKALAGRPIRPVNGVTSAT